MTGIITIASIASGTGEVVVPNTRVRRSRTLSLSIYGGSDTITTSYKLPNNKADGLDYKGGLTQHKLSTKIISKRNLFK